MLTLMLMLTRETTRAGCARLSKYAPPVRAACPVDLDFKQGPQLVFPNWAELRRLSDSCVVCNPALKAGHSRESSMQLRTHDSFNWTFKLSVTSFACLPIFRNCNFIIIKLHYLIIPRQCLFHVASGRTISLRIPSREVYCYLRTAYCLHLNRSITWCRDRSLVTLKLWKDVTAGNFPEPRRLCVLLYRIKFNDLLI